MEKESWQRNHGRGLTRRNHEEGIMEGGLWEASEKHLGGLESIWEASEASGKHLIWEASGKHLGSICEASGRHLGGIWGFMCPWEAKRRQRAEKLHTSQLKCKSSIYVLIL